jgi:hypothetical protein
MSIPHPNPKPITPLPSPLSPHAWTTKQDPMGGLTHPPNPKLVIDLPPAME